MTDAALADQAAPHDATLRLAAILATVAGVQAVAHLFGVGARGIRVDFVNLLALWAAVALYQGRRWGRTALLTLSLLGLFLVFGFLLASDIARTSGRLLFGFAAVFTMAQIVALAYTLPEEGIALGLPEPWRPFATNPVLHKAILVLGLVGVFV